MNRLLAVWAIGPGLLALCGAAAPFIVAGVLFATCLSFAVLEACGDAAAPAVRGMLRA